MANVDRDDGQGREEDRQRASDAGFGHHLTNPVDPLMIDRLMNRGSGREPDGSTF